MKSYNLTLLKEQCGNDKLFFNDMLDIFIRTSLEGLLKMEEANLKNDFKALGDCAHKILSPFMHIHAAALIILLKEIEASADSKTLTSERAGFLVQKIKLQAEELINDLRLEYFK